MKLLVKRRDTLFVFAVLFQMEFLYLFLLPIITRTWLPHLH
ncbi:hypothetical protein X975_17376, partial [Stegodyphus mimosarum]